MPNPPARANCPIMPRYALKIEYDGRPFCGWQRQAVLPSVQATIEQALARLDPGLPAIAAAGRTDTGVHATGQVAHCDMQRDWNPFRLMEALNHHLRPAPVAVVACTKVDAEFHARFSAQERRYLFRLLARRAPQHSRRGRSGMCATPWPCAPCRTPQPICWANMTSRHSAQANVRRHHRSRHWTQLKLNV